MNPAPTTSATSIVTSTVTPSATVLLPSSASIASAITIPSNTPITICTARRPRPK